MTAGGGNGITRGIPFDLNMASGGLYLGAPASITETSTPIAGVAANDIVAAIAHVNNNADEYTLLLDNDTTVSTEQTLDVANVKLTIIGIGSERKITLTATGRMFTVGDYPKTGIEMTIGNNITLKPTGQALLVSLTYLVVTLICLLSLAIG